ncbi:MAG: hypothetical protein OXM88_08315, partial [bacterium]|nr:hypothetical protein [bacterium]
DSIISQLIESPGKPGRFRVMNADGTRRQQLTTYGELPQWSPDGTQIVYNIDNHLTDLDGGVWVMNTDGTNQRQLTNDDGRNPQWSPDGTQITFHNDYGDVFLINVDPPNLPQLLVGNGWDPVWSPSALTGS